MKAQTFNRSERKEAKLSKVEKVYNAVLKMKRRAAANQKIKEKA